MGVTRGDVFDAFVKETDGHVWKQIGMTGSDHDQCVLCDARSEGLGREADAASLVPCKYHVVLREYQNGVAEVRVSRFPK
jgi:hypothetical protein